MTVDLIVNRIRAADNLAQLLHDSAQKYADLTAFDNFSNTLSFGDLAEFSDHFAAYLQKELGINKGDRIALMSPNVLAFPVATMGILKSGAVQVNVNPLYTPAELKHQLNDSGAETLVVFSGSTTSFAAIKAETSIRRVIVINLSDCGQNTLPTPPTDAELGPFTLFSDALKAGSDLDLSPVGLGKNDLAFLQYTGGTTGPSKGAVLNHGNLLANLLQTYAQLPSTFEEGAEIMVAALPMYHIFGLMANFVCYVVCGGRNVLITNPRDMDNFVKTISDIGFTRINGVNTLYAGLMTHPDFGALDFSKLKLALGGGTATLRSTSDKWEGFTGKPILEAYGLSETSPVLTLPSETQTKYTGNIGKALADTEIKLLDDDDNEVAVGERGELVCRGPQVMTGYYQRPEATAEAFTKDGFFRTGDIAIVDADGNFKIVDRKKDMVLVSGFNVYPNEVEQAAAHCPGVVECACIGIRDEKTGEAVKLFVVKEAGSGVTPDDIIAHCAVELTSYKVPKQIAFIDEVPKSAVGKMLRRELRDA